jgi:hypothetical protein
VSIDVQRRDGSPAMLVRSGTPADLPAIADLSMQYAAEARFALERSPALLEFAFARRRLLAGLGPAGLRQVEFFVAEEGHRPVAYVFITRGPSGAILEECGDRDPSGARIGAMLQALAARAPAEPALILRGWLPDALRPPQVRIVDSIPSPEVMMMRSLTDTEPDWEGRVVYWNTDLF